MLYSVYVAYAGIEPKSPQSSTELQLRDWNSSGYIQTTSPSAKYIENTYVLTGKSFFTVTVFQNQKLKPKEVCVLKSLESLCLCHYVLFSQVVSVCFCCISKQYHFELLFPLFMVRCRIIRKRVVVTLWSANSKKRTNS